VHLDEVALDVEALEHGGDLRPAPVHHHHVHAQLYTHHTHTHVGTYVDIRAEEGEMGVCVLGLVEGLNGGV
jgi:hypothetical protein